VFSPDFDEQPKTKKATQRRESLLGCRQQETTTEEEKREGGNTEGKASELFSGLTMLLVAFEGGGMLPEGQEKCRGWSGQNENGPMGGTNCGGEKKGKGIPSKDRMGKKKKFR